MNIYLRPVEARDFADLRALAETFHSEDGHPIDAKAEAAALIFSLGDAGIQAWLALCDGRLVGYAVLTQRRDELGTRVAEIEELYVVPDGRRALASAILEQVCREAFGLGVRRIFVALRPFDVGRRYYFWRHGFDPSYAGPVVRLLP
jgi:hypothetical protein